MHWLYIPTLPYSLNFFIKGCHAPLQLELMELKLAKASSYPLRYANLKSLGKFFWFVQASF